MLPLSTAVMVNGTVFISGIPPLLSGKLFAPDDPAAQTECVMKRMKEALQAFGMGLEQLAYVQVFLRSIADYQVVNEVYEKLMPMPYPARKVIVTDFVLEQACVEMSGIASLAPKIAISID